MKPCRLRSERAGKVGLASPLDSTFMWPDRAALAVRTDTPECKCEGSSKEKPENGLGISGRVVSPELRAG